MASEDFAGLERLGRQPVLPIATGESHMTAYEFKRLLDTGAVDVLMPYLKLCGGLDEAQTAVQLARLNGLRISPHVWGTAIGLAAAVHYTAAIPTEPHAMQSLTADPIVAVDGMLGVPQGPGLGIDVDGRALRRFAAA